MGRALPRGAEREARQEAGDEILAGDETLAPLREMLAPAAFREILTLYEETIATAGAEIAAAGGRGDLAALAAAAHDLAGMCGQIGSGRASDLAREIEQACAEGRIDAACTLAGQVASPIDETLAALARYHDSPEA